MFYVEGKSKSFFLLLHTCILWGYDNFQEIIEKRIFNLRIGETKLKKIRENSIFPGNFIKPSIKRVTKKSNQMRIESLVHEPPLNHNNGSECNRKTTVKNPQYMLAC